MGGFVTDENTSDFVDLEQARRKRSDPLSASPPPPQNAHRFVPRDWTKGQDSEHLDLESALRMDSTQLVEASK